MDKNTLIHNSFTLSPWMSVVLRLKGIDLIVFSVVYSISKTGQSEYYGGTKYINNIFGIHKTSTLDSFNKLVDKGYIIKVVNVINGIAKPKYSANIKLIDELIDKYLKENGSNNDNNDRSEIPNRRSEIPTEVVGNSYHNNINSNINNNNKYTHENVEQSSTSESVKSENGIGINYKSLVELFNKEFDGLLPKVIKLTEARKKAIKNRIEENSKEDVIKVFNNVKSSDFLLGKGQKWKCNFDFIFNSSNFVKILEGNYNDKQEKINYYD